MANTSSQNSMPEDTKTLITILLLVFVFPVGFILMWVWTKWKLWVKLLITIPIILFMLGMVGVIGLGIKAAQQAQNERSTVINQATDSTRIRNVDLTIEVAKNYFSEKGTYPSSLEEMSSWSGDNAAMTVPEGFSYKSVDSGRDCQVSVMLSTGESYSQTCSSATPQ